MAIVCNERALHFRHQLTALCDCIAGLRVLCRISRGARLLLRGEVMADSCLFENCSKFTKYSGIVHCQPTSVICVGMPARAAGPAWQCGCVQMAQGSPNRQERWLRRDIFSWTAQRRPKSRVSGYCPGSRLRNICLQQTLSACTRNLGILKVFCRRCNALFRPFSGPGPFVTP